MNMIPSSSVDRKLHSYFHEIFSSLQRTDEQESKSRPLPVFKEEVKKTRTNGARRSGLLLAITECFEKVTLLQTALYRADMYDSNIHIVYKPLEVRYISTKFQI